MCSPGITSPFRVSADAADDPVRARLLALLGGPRGIVDGGLPPLVFVLTHALAGAATGRSTALLWAAVAATITGGVLVALRLVRGEPLRQVLGGLAGLAVAVAFALQAGEARGFFLPAIYVDATYAVVFLGSALLGRPLVATGYRLLTGGQGTAALRRTLTVATVGWSVVFGVRAAGQAALYLADRPGLLAASKLLLGWPLTLLAVVLTLASIRRSTARSAGISPPP